MYAHRSQVGSRSFRAAGSNDVFAYVEVRDRFYGALIGRPLRRGAGRERAAAGDRRRPAASSGLPVSAA